ncbi:hypothetical protein QN277_027149 [Acacia crassicarpa]|uniref:Uncharacterized protein n=1 Tax=Acacia crassicarpa TaxID=499986 RepID=A0AAE1JDM6_9FABA|nr:hypothetical protein QN277_027149 [Acacia crassicarpa]
MPFIIFPAICKQRNEPFEDEDVCTRNGMAYFSLSMALGNIYTWTYLYNLVRVSSCENSTANEVEDSPLNPESLLTTSPNTSTCPAGPLVSVENISQTEDCASGLDIETARTEGAEDCASGLEIETARTEGAEDSASGLDIETARTEGVVAKVTKREKVMKLLKKLEKKMNLKALLAPPTIGSIIGLIIGVIPPFRKALVGENAPLHVIEDSISMLGDAAIPAMTLLVGANLASGLQASSIRLSVIMGIIIVRYIALPAFGVGIVKGAIHIGLIPNDPLYRFLLLLQYAVPPAVTISTITQLFGAGVVECSVVMLVTYTCASASLTVWSTFFIWLVL